MSSKTSPFFGINYGWPYGEDGWNGGMDYNLKALSFLSVQAVDGVVSSLPIDPVEGESYIKDNLLNVFIDAKWLVIQPEDGFVVRDKSTGTNLKFSGTVWEEVVSANQVKVGFIGDSLTQSSVRNGSWADETCRLMSQLLGVDVLHKNAAIGGSTFDSALNSKQHDGATKSQVGEIIDFAPDLVFVSLGINDLVYLQTATPSQVTSAATTIYNQIKAALPGSLVIYVEELTYDITGGLSPTSLQNQQTIPFNHTAITLKGLSGVRINNSTYNTTAVSSTALTRLQNWATATTNLRNVFDGYTTVNLWKMARLGCMIDTNHVDRIGHIYWAWEVIRYLSTTAISVKGVPFSGMQFTGNTNQLFSLDEMYSQALVPTAAAQAVMLYHGQNLYERMQGWLHYNPRARMDYGRALKDGKIPETVNIVNVKPNSAVFVGWDSLNFVDTGRLTSPQGVHLQTFIPIEAFPLNSAAGTHTVWYAVSNGDGTYDAFTGDVVISNTVSSSSSKIALKFFEANTTVATNGSIVVLAPTGTSVDEIGIGSAWDKMTVPASIAGKKIRLSGNLRIQIPVSATANNVDVYAGFRKNGQALTGNTIAAGRGMPSARFVTYNQTATTLVVDLNFVGAAMDAVAGDYYEVLLVINAPSATSGTLLGQVYSWVQMEVLA